MTLDRSSQHPSSGRKRKRPHPAAQARRVALTASVAGLAGLTGGLALRPAAKAQAVTASSATSAVTRTSDDGSYAGDDGSWVAPSASAPSSVASGFPVTSSHGS